MDDKLKECLEKLHDATLVGVYVDWGSGEVRFDLETGMTKGHEIVKIRGRGLTFLDCPRRYPWGPSESVNSVWAEKVVGNVTQLNVEMQSGDVIIAIVNEFVVDL